MCQSTLMDWSHVRRILLAMQPSGPTGFEGLIADLLCELTGEPFVLAAAGSQRSGDARNLIGTTAIQAKRYSSAKLDLKSIEGDIRESLRALPNLQVYVIAAPKSTAQFHDKLDAIRDETALETVILDYENQDSFLAALISHHWRCASNLVFRGPDATKLRSWARSHASKPVSKRRYVQLRRSIERDVGALSRIAKGQAVALRLQSRPPILAKTPSNQPPPSDLVSRSAVEDRALRWWENGPQTLLLQGEEGVGKTTVALAVARRIATERGALALFLTSPELTGLLSLDDLLSRAISKVAPNDQARRERLLLQLRERWRRPTLLVIDGVNERDLLEGAQRLLRDPALPMAPYLRLIFTTRPLERRDKYESILWSACTSIQIAAFSPAEFEDACALRSVPTSQVPAAVSELARIPRYFDLCIRHRTRLGGLGQISKEVVLWLDLVERIDSDRAVRERLGWTSQGDAADVLTTLARKATYQAADSPIAASAVLQSLFDAPFGSVRSDLLELRILRDASRLGAQLSRDHVRLGWALYALKITSETPLGSIRNIADAILSRMEPQPADDTRADAFFCALVLDAMTPQAPAKSGRLPSEKRAALMHVWLTTPNSRVSPAQVSFCVQNDLVAYLECLESLSAESWTVADEPGFLSPLKDLWREAGPDVAALGTQLRRWLILAWRGNGPATGYLRRSTGRFPMAASESQLQLCRAALAVVAARPDPGMLDSIAVARASLRESYSVREGRRTFLKPFEDTFGRLMRWYYTEDVIRHLRKLVKASRSSNSAAAVGARLLANSLGLLKLPVELRLPPRGEERLVIPPVEALRRRRRLFSAEDLAKFVGPDIACLAIRTDLPTPVKDDVQSIVSTICDLSTKGVIKGSAGVSREDLVLRERWPWYARLQAPKVHLRVGEFVAAALEYRNAAFLLRFLSGAAGPVRPSPAYVSIDRVAANLKASQLRYPEKSDTASFWLERIILDTRGAARMNAVKAWLDHQELSDTASLYPLPTLLQAVSSTELVILARRRILRRLSRPPGRLKGARDFLLCSIASARRIADRGLYRKARGRSQSTRSETERSWLMAVALSAAPKRDLKRDLAQGSLPPVLEPNLPSLPFELETDLLWSRDSSLGYEDLLGRYPRDALGIIFLAAARMRDLDRWARDVLELTALSAAEVSGRSGIGAVTLDEQGRLASAAGAAARRWKPWIGTSLQTFCGTEALAHWARGNQPLFRQSAFTILSALEDHPRTILIGGVVESILRVLAGLEPEEATAHYLALLRVGGIPAVSTAYGSLAFHESLWVGRDNRSSRDASKRLLLTTARTDAEIAQVSIAALAASSEAELLRISESFLSGSCAKDRALAISALAIAIGTHARQTLERSARADPSRWVRTHAEWALAASAQERSARATYRRALRDGDAYSLSAKLQVLAPALSPAARWWRRRVERLVGLPSDPTAKAILISFWYHWESVVNRPADLAGRRLTEFCRGDIIRNVGREAIPIPPSVSEGTPR